MWDDFIGNARVVGWLSRAIATEQVSHAYLFTGPDQVGKRTLALAFAQAIQCQHRPAESGVACGACNSCRKILHGNHPDLAVMALPKDKQHYAIEQVRDLIDAAALKPTEGRRRIFILPDVDLFTLPALQASLKVLEEPPASAMLLLTCTSVDMLLPTIVSRCQQAPLLPVPPDVLAPALARRGEMTPEAAQEIAILSGGRPGWAIDAIDHPESLAERRQTLRDLATLTGVGRAERIAAAGRYAPDKEKAQRTLELWLPWWRDVALTAHGAPDIIRHADDQLAIQAQARAWGSAASERFVRAMLVALEQLDQNANPRLVFEVLLQSLPGVK
jgi:DNA polymerase-3 subunit delta'